MRGSRGNPNRAQGRDDPDAPFGAHRHDAFRSKDQLVFRVKVRGDDVTVVKFIRDTGDLRQRPYAPVEKDAVALLRHFLSQ